MAQRKIDVVLDSVRRLLRIGATANLVNLLQKQHPADLAQVFSELGEKDRHAAFSLLVERNSQLAMEALERARPRRGRRAAGRPIRRGNRPARCRSSRPTTPRRSSTTCPEPLSAAVLELIAEATRATTSATCSSTTSRPPAAS